MRLAVVVRIETSTLMPEGGFATVSMRPMGSAYRVSDDGAGRAVLLALGFHELTSGDTQRGNEIAHDQGMIYDEASFSLPNVSADQLPSAIVYVADAARR